MLDFTNSFRKYIFVSPHLDDAVLSCCYLIQKLKSLGKKINIISVFTASSYPPYSKVAKDFIFKCGYKDADKLFDDRKIEDKKAQKFLGCSYIHLDFIDAAWRTVAYKKGTGLINKTRHILNFPNYLYGNEKNLFSGCYKKQDHELIKILSQKFNDIVNQANETIILSPLGIGGHVDNVIVRESLRKLSDRIIYWEDYPYSLKQGCTAEFLNKYKYKPYFEIQGDSKLKEKAIRFYNSQLKGLFVNRKIPFAKERYYKTG